MINDEKLTENQYNASKDNRDMLISGAALALAIGGWITATYVATPTSIMQAAAANLLSSLLFLSTHYQEVGKLAGCAAVLFCTPLFSQNHPADAAPAKTMQPK